MALGRGDEAVQYLQRRLDEYGDNSSGEVQKALDKAQGKKGRRARVTTEHSAVAAAVAGIPFMSPDQGRVVFDHVRATRPREALELGTAHGVAPPTSPPRRARG